jgi:Flp pilus assembly protein TadB
MRASPLFAQRRPIRVRADKLFDAPGGFSITRKLHERLARFRTAKQIEPSAIAHWADDLARHLRSGATLHDSLTSVIPSDAALTTATSDLRHSLDRGATVAAASESWHARLGEEVGGRVELLLTVASVLSVSATLGGPAAAPFDRLAVAMRQHASDGLERAAQSAQANISARVLTLLPISVLALLITTDADVRSLITTPLGATVISLGLTLNLIGAFWMRHIVGSLR